MRLAAVLALAILPLAACDSGDDADTTSLFGIAPTDASVVLRADRSGVASLNTLAGEEIGAALLAEVPADRIDDLVVATDASAETTVVGIDVSGNASDFTGFLVNLDRTHRGAALYRAPGGTPFVGVRRGDLIVGTTEAALLAALDRLDGASPRLADDATASRLFRRVGGTPVGILTADFASLATGLDSLDDTLDFVPVDRMAIGGQITGSGPSTALDGTLWLAPRAGTEPATLSGLLAVAVSVLRQQPGTDPQTAALLSRLAFTVDGADVRTPVLLPLSLVSGGPIGALIRAPEAPVR